MYADQLVPVRAALARRGLTSLSSEWLSECLQFLAESFGPAVRLSLADLTQHVYDQWLEADLTSLATPCLPPGLAQVPQTSLPGGYPLQVQALLDIGQPAYGQYLKLRQLDSGNTEVGGEEMRPTWQPRPTRTLQLQLTDGVQTVTALEYQSVPELRPDLRPGTKLLLTGPLECRRGVLLLTPDRVTVLGGGVDALEAAAPLLAVLEARLRAAGGEIPQTGGISNDSGYQSGNSSVTQQPPPTSSRTQPPNVQPPPVQELVDIFMDEDPFEDDMDDALLATLDIPEPAIDGAPDAGIGGAGAQPAVIEPDPLAVGSPEAARPRELVTLTRLGQARSSGPGDVRPPPVKQQRLDSFLRREPPVASGIPPAPTATGPPAAIGTARRPSAPFSFLTDLKPNSKVTVKAFISTQAGRLERKSGLWRMEVKLNDGARSTLAVMSDVVLKQLVGFSVSEIEMMSMVARTNPTVREQLRSALMRAQERIINLSCLMELEVGGGEGDLPRVTALREVTAGTVEGLRAHLRPT